MKRIALYIYAFVVGILFIACGEESDANGTIPEVAAVVRIQATLDFTGSTPSTRSMTKAAGEIDEGDTDYSEGKEPGNDTENKVSTARLVAINPLSGSIIKNILYRLPGEVLGLGEEYFAFQYDQNTGKMKLNLDMQIMSGSYIFVLVANEEASWGLGTTTSYSALMNSASNFLNPIVTVDDLNNKVAQKSGIPMIGQAGIQVKANSNATAENPQIINDPVIELERTLVKVEVSIRNTDDGTNVIETAKLYRIKSATLINANQKYNLFKESNTTVTEQFSNYVNNVTHTTGSVFKKQNIFTGYIAERKSIIEANATTVRIVTEANDDEFVYDLPLFQYEDATKTKRNYDMLRNTIYRLGTRLEGKELGYQLDVFTEVEGWKEINVDVIDPFTEHPLNVDRKIIYVDTKTSETHTETITFWTDLEYMDYSQSGITGVDVNDVGSDYGTYGFELTIPHESVVEGTKQSIIFSFGRGGEKVADIAIVVKPKY